MNGKSFFKNTTLLIGLLVVGTMVLAACSPASTPVVEQPMPVDIELTLQVAKDAKLGDILVDGKGMTLYMYTVDEPNKSNCSGGCLDKWPPLLAMDNPNVGEGVDKSLLGTADLPDGSKIVTYNKMPLYYWVNDKEPGQTSGQDVGGVWYVVSPAGEVIK